MQLKKTVLFVNIFSLKTACAKNTVKSFAFFLTDHFFILNFQILCTRNFFFASQSIKTDDSILLPTYSQTRLLMHTVQTSSCFLLSSGQSSEGWRIQNKSPTEIPTQHNSFDCGIFCLLFAKAISKRIPPLFIEKNCKKIRRKVAFELLTKHIF